ncbi:MAG: hypothetical protein ACPGVH_04305 [Chitinophagales bacterium]
MKNSIIPFLVEKEEISKFTFPKIEVLVDEKAISTRTKNLLKGLKLGNVFKNKVEIFFEDNESLKKVETTIWSITENYLILKRNTVIPINRVHSIAI